MQSPRVSVPDQVESLASRNTSGITTTQASSRSLSRAALPARSLSLHRAAVPQVSWHGRARGGRAPFPAKLWRVEALQSVKVIQAGQHAQERGETAFARSLN